MFVMEDNPEFLAEAKGKTPGEEGESFSFKARFVALSASEQKEFDLATEEGTVAFLQRTFVGMSDVFDADKNPVPFDQVRREWMIDRPHVRGALIRAYFSEVYGAALGN